MGHKMQGTRVLFATVPADGHFNPLTGLAVYLMNIGCDVRWYTSTIFTDKLQKLGIPLFPFEEAMDINALNMETLLPDRKLFTDAAAKLDYDLIHVFENRSTEYYDDIRHIQNAFDFEIVIADNMFSGIPFIKHELSIPVMSVGIIPLAETSVDLAPYGMGLLPPEDEEKKKEYADLRALVNGVIFKRSIDNFAVILDEYEIPNEKSFFADVLIKQSDMYLQIGTPGFEYKRSDTGSNVRFIGALFPAEANDGHTRWSDERLSQYKKIILVTHGTVEPDTAKLIEPALEAFKDSDTLVIAVTGGKRSDELRKKFPAKNLIIEDYIPFDEIMPLVHCYVTNGGYSGTLLAVKHKLPMVAAGVHEGKNEVCARIGYFNYGIDLRTETPSPAQLKGAVEEVLRNKLYRKNVSRLSTELNRYDSYSLCAKYIKNLIVAAAKLADN